VHFLFIKYMILLFDVHCPFYFILKSIWPRLMLLEILKSTAEAVVKFVRTLRESLTARLRYVQ
jgi:hypothetical protein